MKEKRIDHDNDYADIRNSVHPVNVLFSQSV